MIEVIYKDEKQNEKGDKGMLCLPKNIRQIGIPGEEYRIYIEDYVYTFLEKTAEKAKQEEKGSVLIFTGETKWDSGKGYLFIKGALLAEVGEATAEHVEFGDVTWQKIHEEIEEYFPGQEIAGWFLVQKALPLKVTEGLQRIHMKFFGGEKILMLMEPIEKEEAFFRYENSTMIRESGYYIYYEKNPCMQTYMLEKGPELQEPEQEDVKDEAVRAFRKIIQKKQSDEKEKTEEKTSVFSYAATACLVLAVMTVGVQFYQNYNNKNQMRTITEVSSQEASSSKTTESQEKTEMKKKKEQVTPTSALEATNTPAPVTIGPTQEPLVTGVEQQEETGDESDMEENAAKTKNTQEEQKIYREESDSRKAERRVRQENSDDTEEKTEESASTAVESQGESYVIKPGDTLYQISISIYGTMDKVQEICKANGLTEDEIIYPGQIIVLP